MGFFQYNKMSQLSGHIAPGPYALDSGRIAQWTPHSNLWKELVHMEERAAKTFSRSNSLADLTASGRLQPLPMNSLTNNRVSSTFITHRVPSKLLVTGSLSLRNVPLEQGWFHAKLFYPVRFYYPCACWLELRLLWPTLLPGIGRMGRFVDSKEFNLV